MITKEFRTKVREAILHNRELYPSISDANYAKRIGVKPSVFSRIKSGETEKIAADSFWIEIGRKLNVSVNSKKWAIAETDVYKNIKEQITFCKEYAKATILIDECGIGKTFCTKHIITTIENGYYIDCSQATKRSKFIRYFAQTLGLNTTGRLDDIKENIKYYINIQDKPFIALDDSGYLDPAVHLDIIEIWNATESQCGWLMIGDDSLQTKLERGVASKKIGFKALFSRFSDEYVNFIPVDITDKQNYLKQLIHDVASVNLSNKSQINKLVKICIGKEKTLRHLETLIQLSETA